MTQSINNHVSLQSYGVIADKNLSQVALGGKSGVQDASKAGVGALKRFFNTEASKNLNRAVLADFQKCLKKTYGNRIAEMAVNRYIGADAYHKGTKLSSQKIKSAMAFAQNIYSGTLSGNLLTESEAASLRHLCHNFEGRNEISLRSATLRNVEFTFRALDSQEGNKPVAESIRTFAKLNAHVNDLLSEMPTDVMSFRVFSEDIDNLKRDLENLRLQMSTYRGVYFDSETNPLSNSEAVPKKIELNNAKDTADALTDEVQNLIASLEAKRTEAQGVAESNPTTYKAVGEAASMYVDAMEETCLSLADGKYNDLRKVCGNDGMAQNFAMSMHLMQGGNADKVNLVDMLKDRAVGKTVIFSDIHCGNNNIIAGDDIRALMDKVMPEVDLGLKMNAPNNWQFQRCDGEKRLGKDFSKRLAKFACGFADLAGKKISGRNFKTVKSNLSKVLPDIIREDYGSILNKNKQGWKIIEKPMTFQYEGKNFACKSTITPASKMDGPVGERYIERRDKGGNVIQPKVNGVMCHGFGETYHAVNLAKSELTLQLPQPDGTLKEKTVFKGIRHGVNAATALKNEDDFFSANLSRAQETAIAAFTSSDELMEQARLAISQKDYNPDNPPVIEFTMSSVSLLTPDNFRSDVDTDEGRMLKGQTAAFKALDKFKSGFTIKIDNKDVNIKPKIMTFNFGVNSSAVSWYNGLTGCWSNSDPMNNEGLGKLADEVQKFVNKRLENNLASNSNGDISQENVPDKDSQIALKLLNQIKQMHAKHEESAKTGDNYKMATRVAVLTYLLGGVPCWNCKSGKDRTGMMDAECKALATYIALSGDVPEPDEMPEDLRQLNRKFAVEGGNHEMQKYNTGLAGFKLGGGIYKKTIGGDLNLSDFIQGGSHMVKA